MIDAVPMLYVDGCVLSSATENALSQVAIEPHDGCQLATPMVEVPLAVVRSLKATLDAYSILEDSVSRAEAANQAMMDAITAVAPQEPEEPQEVASSPEAKRLSESERHRLFQQCEKLEGILHEREVAKATKEKRRKAMAKQKPKAVAKKKAQCKPKAKAKARSAAAKRRGAAKKKEVAKKDTKSKEKNKDKGNAKSKRQDDTSKKLHSVPWQEMCVETCESVLVASTGS